MTIRRVLLECFESGGTDTLFRWTCLACGRQWNVSAPEADEFIGMSPDAAPVTHDCAITADYQRSVPSNWRAQHWHQVVRDAFIDGRDSEAVELICSALTLVGP